MSAKYRYLSLIFFCIMIFLSFPLVGFAIPCDSDGDCDDGAFCNGIEACFSGACVAGLPVDCDDSIACTTDSCGEETRSCVHTPPDADGDGHGDTSCVGGDGNPLGDDCDDEDGTRFPGNTEVCDSHDEDCDPATFGSQDLDIDGFIDSACCNGSMCGNDCDDERDSIHPIQNEVCNGLDDDCDGTVDLESANGQNLATVQFPDADGDGFGDPSQMMNLCPGTPGYSTLGNDCDDSNPAIFPGAMICGSPANPSNVMVCMSDGTYAVESCDPNTKSFCITQPNGAGICQPKKG